VSDDSVMDVQAPRRGWQLPHEANGPADDQTPAQPTQTATVPQARPAEAAATPTPTMRDSVMGQVTNVTLGSTSVNQDTEAIAMLRVEQHDPHAGRTSIYEIRLDGDETIGFARVGDWVEAVGKRKSSHIKAVRCVNLTTGAVYAPSAARRHRMLIAFLAFLAVVAIMATIFIIAVHKGDQSFQNQVKRDNAEFNQNVQKDRQAAKAQCEASGAPQGFCDSIAP